jgi:hypothetical protein
LVLSSYGIGDLVGTRYPPVAAFMAELGASAADVVVHHARTLRDHDDYLRALPATPALIYACGASVMAVALRWLTERGAADVPVIYWGSHIMDCGQPVNRPPDAPGVRAIDLPMPLYQSHRQFRILKMLFPRLERVYCAFSMDSAFVHGWRRDHYLHAIASDTAWIPSASDASAFPGLARLGEIIDVEVFEHPCADRASAARAVDQIPAARQRDRDDVRACLISCIDCLHVDGAIDDMVRAADAARVPFVGLNFGAFLAGGPIVSAESDMIGAARVAARMAAAALRGEPVAERIVGHDTLLFRCNPTLMDAWGIELATDEQAQLRRVFHELLC